MRARLILLTIVSPYKRIYDEYGIHNRSDSRVHSMSTYVVIISQHPASPHETLTFSLHTSSPSVAPISESAIPPGSTLRNRAPGRSSVAKKSPSTRLQGLKFDRPESAA